MDKFKDVKLRDQLTLEQIYELRDIDDNEISADTKVSICTVQGLLKRTILLVISSLRRPPCSIN